MGLTDEPGDTIDKPVRGFESSSGTFERHHRIRSHFAVRDCFQIKGPLKKPPKLNIDSWFFSCKFGKLDVDAFMRFCHPS
jgi:hypothetical protein